MKFKTLTGSTADLKNAKKYLINWRSKSKSKFQKSVKDFLHTYWRNDIVFEELKIVGTRMSFDFYNANKKIAVEVQGAQHTKFVKFFHNNRLKYLEQLKRDDKKLRFCEINNITLVEIYPNDDIGAELFESFGVIL
jgi:very-short-patch-repair endonuclease